jgi:hypothetical protein
MAADSLTSRGQNTINAATIKLHQVASNVVAASCGCSRVNGRDWSEILAGFTVSMPGTSLAIVSSNLQIFLDRIIGAVPKNNVGACQGGNTFLLAGYDPTTSCFGVSKLSRIGDRRAFEPIMNHSIPPSGYYIEWVGDTPSIMKYIEEKNKYYQADMSQKDAVTFAVNAIRGGIAASQAAGKTTIGGDFIQVAIVSDSNVVFSKHPPSLVRLCQWIWNTVKDAWKSLKARFNAT